MPAALALVRQRVAAGTLAPVVVLHMGGDGIHLQPAGATAFTQAVAAPQGRRAAEVRAGCSGSRGTGSRGRTAA